MTTGNTANMTSCVDILEPCASLAAQVDGSQWLHSVALPNPTTLKACELPPPDQTVLFELGRRLLFKSLVGICGYRADTAIGEASELRNNKQGSSDKSDTFHEMAADMKSSPVYQGNGHETGRYTSASATTSRPSHASHTVKKPAHAIHRKQGHGSNSNSSDTLTHSSTTKSIKSLFANIEKAPSSSLLRHLSMLIPGQVSQLSSEILSKVMQLIMAALKDVRDSETASDMLRGVLAAVHFLHENDVYRVIETAEAIIAESSSDFQKEMSQIFTIYCGSPLASKSEQRYLESLCSSDPKDLKTIEDLADLTMTSNRCKDFINNLEFKSWVRQFRSGEDRVDVRNNVFHVGTNLPDTYGDSTAIAKLALIFDGHKCDPKSTNDVVELCKESFGTKIQDALSDIKRADIYSWEPLVREAESMFRKQRRKKNKRHRRKRDRSARGRRLKDNQLTENLSKQYNKPVDIVKYARSKIAAYNDLSKLQDSSRSTLSLAFLCAICESIYRTFIHFDEELLFDLLPDSTAGSTCSLALFVSNPYNNTVEMVSANIGDSPVVHVQDEKARQISENHNTFNRAEQQRIHDAQIDFPESSVLFVRSSKRNPRAKGSIRVAMPGRPGCLCTRAFHDKNLKHMSSSSSSSSSGHPSVTPAGLWNVPFVDSVTVHPWKFLGVAVSSDGVIHKSRGVTPSVIRHYLQLQGKFSFEQEHPSCLSAISSVVIAAFHRAYEKGHGDDQSIIIALNPLIKSLHMNYLKLGTHPPLSSSLSY